MSKFSPASNAYSRPKCVWEAAVDVIVNALYQKATINLLPPCSHDAYSNASSTALHPLISFKRQNVGQRRRFWRSGAERRITLQLLKKLASIFQVKKVLSSCYCRYPGYLIEVFALIDLLAMHLCRSSASVNNLMLNVICVV